MTRQLKKSIIMSSFNDYVEFKTSKSKHDSSLSLNEKYFQKLNPNYPTARDNWNNGAVNPRVNYPGSPQPYPVNGIQVTFVINSTFHLMRFISKT